MGHTQAQWIDRIRAWLGDLGVYQLIDSASIPGHLEAALAEYANDNPRQISELFSGDGTVFDFTLTGAGEEAWIDKWSKITEVEYPTGNRDRTLLELRDTEVLKGTATVRLINTTPATGTDNLEITYTAIWPHPTGTDTDDEINAIHFPAVAALAAGHVARGKAGELARRQSSSVAGELFQHDATPLFTAASDLRKYYRAVVLGQEPDQGPGDASEPALSVERIDVFPGALFHRH